MLWLGDGLLKVYWSLLTCGKNWLYDNQFIMARQSTRQLFTISIKACLDQDR